MEDRYRLTIIIPHYNTLETLEKLLQTIPKENDIQTIVIDDHSDDNVKKQLQELKTLYDCRNILFLDNNTAEHNPGATRNIGLNYAEGAWLLFADADDYFLDGFYDIVKKYFDTDYDIVFFPPASIQLDTGKTDIRNVGYANSVTNYLQRPCMSTESCLRYSWPVPWSKLIRTSLVKEHNIAFESIKVAEDDLFSVKVGTFAKKIAASEDTIYCVTRSVGSLTTKRDIDLFDIRAREAIRRATFLREHLTKKEFRASGAYRLTIWYLMLIMQRKYGMRVLMKYFKLFRQNHMPIFNIQMFNPTNLMRWIRGRRYEMEIKKKYGR